MRKFGFNPVFLALIPVCTLYAHGKALRLYESTSYIHAKITAKTCLYLLLAYQLVRLLL